MTLIRTTTNWALGITAAFVILLLNAYLEHKHGDVEVLTAEVSNDRAAEFAAINNQAANVAMKE
jgi:hypothetical protein